MTFIYRQRSTGSKMTSKNTHVTIVNQQQLREMITSVHHSEYHLNLANEQPIMSGLFSFSDLASGISVHCNDVIEMQNMSSSIELPPCLSFNIVFKGKIHFNLGKQAYFIGGEDAPEVECSAIILNKPDIMTRHMKQDEHVKKVNVFIKQEWLKKRCKNKQDIAILNKIFTKDLAVYKWQASDNIIKLSKLILQEKVKTGFATELLIEQVALQILAECFDILSNQDTVKLTETNPNNKIMKSDLTIKKQIDLLITKPISLEGIAKSMGLSISTLQRRFKKDYGTTVVDYIRQTRLENARVAIAIKGLSIGEAAYLAGYNHSSNFITAFKKRFNITPASLLKSHALLEES